MGNVNDSPPPEKLPNNPQAPPINLQTAKISYQSIDDIPVEILEQLLSEEIAANSKIEEVLQMDGMKNSRSLKILLLGVDQARLVFLNGTKFIAKSVSEAERLSVVNYLRFGIIQIMNKFANKSPQLQDYLTILMDYPHPSTLPDPPEQYLEQTKNLLQIFLEDTSLCSILQQIPPTHQMDFLFSEIIPYYSKIFSPSYIPSDKDYLFTKIFEYTLSDPFKIIEEKVELFISNSPWVLHLTHLSPALRTRSKRVLEQFDQIDGILFFVDLMDYENPQLISFYDDFVNGTILGGKPVMLIGYNKTSSASLSMEGKEYVCCDGEEEKYFKYYLMRRSRDVSVKFIDMNDEEIENILKSIILWKKPIG